MLHARFNSGIGRSACATTVLRPAVPGTLSLRLTKRTTLMGRASSVAQADIATHSKGLAPAVLPGTPKPGEFPISPERLIELAKAAFATRLTDASLLADEFRFEFPVVSLPKKDYLKAVKSFKFDEAFPDTDSHPYDWRVDPYETNRVWFTVRTVATHTGDLHFNGNVLKATNRVVFGAPECMSMIFNAEGKVITYTGGYVMDRRIGNTEGLGAMFGVLAAIGGPVLKPGSLAAWVVFVTGNVYNFFGRFKKEDE